MGIGFELNECVSHVKTGPAPSAYYNGWSAKEPKPQE